ncbi:MAG: ATP-binding cassette domain-containing protein [Eubacterium sp.]|nr:ATP-binding cassette domain-containing protein [Eubacterium sp.]
MIQIQHLYKTFETKDGTVEALKDINIEVEDGDIYGIIGMSGAGKSTLVRCINMIERPTSGKVLIDGVDMGGLSDAELRKVRRQVSMIFQSFNLLMQRTCLKNICFPLELEGWKPEAAKKRAFELLETVGLPDKANAYPAQLSGGQQQRIAIARALATNPKILLCDEATSALDPKTTNQILDLIREINRKFGITVIVITHQMSVVENICNKVSIIDYGVVQETGLVTDIFADPKSEAGRRLVFPDQSSGEIEAPKGAICISLSFNSAESTDAPLIATLAKEKGVAANIMAAQTKTVGGKEYGKMLISVPDDGKSVDIVLSYLDGAKGIRAEVVDLENEHARYEMESEETEADE